MAAGGDYFIKSDGSLWGMGYNADGELGDGTTIDRSSPVQIVSNGVVAVSPPHFIKSDGSLWGMGNNNFGQLGDGTTNSHLIPVLIVPSNVVSVAESFASSFFIKSDGSLWATGWNENGQLGNGTTNEILIPQEILGSNVVEVTSGGGEFASSLFLKSDGSLWGMGNNDFGQLGDGTTNSHSIPVLIVPSKVVSAVESFGCSFFIKADGSLWAMGYNFDGNLGDGSTVDQHSPVQIVSSNVVSLVAGGDEFNFELFLKTDGSLWAMGDNECGELGDGTHSTGYPWGISRPELIVASNVAAVVAGGADSFFLKSDGSLWGMGWNLAGELGDGTTVERDSPVQIVPEGVVAVDTDEFDIDYYYTHFLMSDGSLWGMGWNEYGELGDGTMIEQNSPVLIVPPPPVILNASRENANMRIFWRGIGGSNYVVQASTNLSGKSFGDITPVISLPGTGGVATNYLDTGALSNSPARFYRIRSN